MRRLLIFLVEKLNKEILSTADQTAQVPTSKSKNLNLLIAQRVKDSLNQFWIPSCYKLDGLRIQENDTYAIEV